MNFLRRNSSSTACQSKESFRFTGDPNPQKFNILEIVQIGNLFLVHLVVPEVFGRLIIYLL